MVFLFVKTTLKLKIIEQGKSAPKHPQYRHIKANWPDNARAELRVFHDNGGGLVIMEGS